MKSYSRFSSGHQAFVQLTFIEHLNSTTRPCEPAVKTRVPSSCMCNLQELSILNQSTFTGSLVQGLPKLAVTQNHLGSVLRFLGPTHKTILNRLLNHNLKGSGLNLCAFEREPWLTGYAARMGVTAAT